MESHYFSTVIEQRMCLCSQAAKMVPEEHKSWISFLLDFVSFYCKFYPRQIKIPHYIVLNPTIRPNSEQNFGSFQIISF